MIRKGTFLTYFVPVVQKALSYFPQTETKKIEEIIDKIKRPYSTLERHITAVCRDKFLEMERIATRIESNTTQTNEMTTRTEPKISETAKGVKRIESQMDTVTRQNAEMAQKLDDFKTNRTPGTPGPETEALFQAESKYLNGQSWQYIWFLTPRWFDTTVNGIFLLGCDMQRTQGPSHFHYPIILNSTIPNTDHQIPDYYASNQGRVSYLLSPPRLPRLGRRAQSTSSGTRPRLTVAKILKTIDAPNPLAVVQDIVRILSEATTMEEEALARARWLLTCTRFRAWLVSPESDFLFVDGDCASSITPRTSALSVIGASLLVTIRKHIQACANPSIALGFFCGQHFSPSDDDFEYDSGPHSTRVGPLGVLGSLITQVITYPGTPSWKIDTNTNNQCQSALQAIDDIQNRTNPRQTARAMMHILNTLIRNLPPDTTVYIIIDNVSEQEETVHSEWDEALEEVICGFQKLTTPAPRRSDNIMQERVHVKVLFTSAYRCMAMERHLGLKQSNDIGNYHHIGLWAGNVDSIAGTVSGFHSDFEAMFGGTHRDGVD